MPHDCAGFAANGFQFGITKAVPAGHPSRCWARDISEDDMNALYDKRGIPIERGDVVKVFHFVGSRRKRNFMYHQCLGIREIGAVGTPYLAFSHLNFIENHLERDGPYLERPDDRILKDYEIVQSIDCKHEDRPRLHGAGQSPKGG